MLKTLSEDSESQDLGPCHGFLGRETVGKNTRQLRYFRQPPAIFFTFTLDIEVHDNLLHLDDRILRLRSTRCLREIGDAS